jgi:acetyl esterase/lipase
MRNAMLTVLGLLAIGGCSPRGLVEWALLSHGFELTADLPYGARARERLDVYRPVHGPGKAPVVVFVYGGRWQSGSKEQYRLLGDALTREGVVAVIPDYRLAPEVHFPGWVEDAALAVRWVRDSVARFGGDPGRIYVVGHSAGGHTAMLLALDPRYLDAAGVPRGTVQGFVELAGPVATTWTDADVQALMGPREGWPDTYPLTHASGGAPPLLLMHGSQDRTVSPENARRLAAAVRQDGGCASLRLYRGLDHVGIVIALSLPRLAIAPVMADLMAFVRHPDRCRPAPLATPGPPPRRPPPPRPPI